MCLCIRWLFACVCTFVPKSPRFSFVVGGAVRDAIMGRVPHDYDLTTPATPDQVQKIVAVCLYEWVAWRVSGCGVRARVGACMSGCVSERVCSVHGSE